MWALIWLLAAGLSLQVEAHQVDALALGRKRSPTAEHEAGYSAQMQSRAVDTRIQLEVAEGQPKGTAVGRIPTKPGFTYRFNEPPREFSLDPNTGEIWTSSVLDREGLRNDRYDLVVLSSQPTYPIEVRIVVADVNDNPPEFPEASIAVSFSESAAAGTRLLLDAATDRDAGVNGVSDDYRIVAGNKDDKFRLIVTANPTGDTSYLHLETTGKLDRETVGFYVLNISARDGGAPPKQGFLQVNVTILDVNDNPPIFDHSDYIVSLNESVPPGTSVLRVMATDNDLADNAKITYYLSDTERQFAVDPETGVISTTEILECPQQSCSPSARPGGGCPKSCVFTVFARDHGSPRQDGRTYVTVNLLDANDNDPVIKFSYFPPTAGFATVDENAVNGSVVAAVSVIDKDEGLNGETNVKIVSGNELGHFRLEYTPSFHIVRVNGILDREEISKYNLTVVATDKGTPARTATAFLIIHVNDVNDHEPVFEKSEYSAILSELAPAGTYVAGITATDEDTGVNAQIYYAFVSGNDNQWFDIDANSGLITTKSPLDREVQGTVELKISARDGGPNPKWAYTQLKVTILDENDEAPQFSQQHINVSLSENTPPHTLIAMLTATDHDQGTNGSVTYSLLPGVKRRYADVFNLDSLTGQLTTKTLLDRETIAEYEIHIIAKDQGMPPQSSTATVYLTILDVNDNAPEFYPQQYFISVQENTGFDTSFLQVSATDKDEGKNAIITYKLESGGDGLFSVNKWTGAVSLEGNLRNSQKPIHKLRISARDQGDRKAAEDALVEIIKDSYLDYLDFDNYGSYDFKITEDHDKKSPNIGREVGKVKVRNSSGAVSYAIVYGDPKHSFHIDEHTGKIRTANKIDREEMLMYSLTVTARSGLSYGQTTVNITVLDLNDNPPVFLPDRDEIKLLENAAVGQEIYLAKAKDRDSGINSRISYNLSYNPEDLFKISEATGVIYLKRPVHAEPGTVLHLEVTASDGGSPPLSAKHSIVVTIEDVNDHTPVFDHTSYETSLLESTPVNDRFFALAASDVDLGMNGRILYSITEGNHQGKFGVFPDGYLYVRSSLDREDRDYYSLTVTASDLGNPVRSSMVPVVIHVIDENDNPPEFTNSTFSFSVRENEPPDSFVGKLTATDRDIGRNAELIFYLSNSQNYFAIDPKNGFIKTLHVFDREELVQTTGQNYVTFEAIVTDNGTPRLRDKVKINVFITDVNDNAPKFLRAPYRVQISEGANVGTQVIRIYTTDADEGLNGDVFYTISSGNEENRFVIDEATGQIALNRMLDRESTTKYILTVLARDAGQNERLSASTTVTIDVLDENDNAPEFTQTDSKISVSETTAVNTELVRFRATDADLGVNSDVVFSISAGNRKDTFQIDPTTGTLFLHKQLDYEEHNLYQLNITASDNGNPRLSTMILFTIAIVDANDNPPAFPNTAIVRQIKEGIAVHTPIVTVAAEDPDSGLNGRVTYSIINQEPSDEKRHFGINPTTGVIHTLLPIDRESIDTFRLTVLATDQAQPESSRLSAEKLVTVIVEDVNDNAPVFVSMNSALLPAHRPVGKEGLQIMTVVARDLDSSTNGLVTYELIGGNGDLFRLHRTTGQLFLRRPISRVEARYQLAVKATDEAVQNERKSTDAYITVITGGGAAPGPVFASDAFEGSVYENEPPGTSILSVKAKLDARADVEYYVTNVTGEGHQVDRLFDVDAKLGVLSTAATLDREAGVGTYEIQVYAIVSGGAPRTSSTKVRITVLDKNDSPPSFRDTPLKFSVSEDLGAGEPVATIRAFDPDTIGKLRYTLVSGDDGRFNLDENTGVLRLKDALDRETKDLYKIGIRASDGLQYTDATITIKVTDTNDNPPTFLESAYSFDIPEGAARGSRVGQVKARDPDLGSNSQLTYSVISDWANDVFSLNPQTGVFTLTARLDYEEVQHYILVVQAQDAGQVALSSTLTVYCNVIDLNDNAPMFDPMSYSNEIYENVSIATPVVTVSATDLDSGNNGKIVYSIAAGNDNGDFEILSNGTVRTRRLLDRETQSSYNLIVTATDQAEDEDQRLSSTVQVTITLKDVNDMSPTFITPNETSIAENTPINSVVMAVKAIDKDEGRNGYIEYSLVSSDPQVDGVFSVGAVDGLLRVAGKIDREIRSNYSLLVRAKDRGDPARMSQTRIFIKILDVNDNSPVFDPKQYSASVAENASIGASVLQVAAADIDEGLNGRVRYSIISGDVNRDFSIAEDTGIVRVAKNLNYERKSRYLLTIRAEDCAGDINGDEVQSDTAEVSLSISDINDNPPMFLDSPYLAFVTENVIPPNGGYIITVQAYDADTSPFNNLVRYFIKEGDTDIFKINASTGEISLLRALDREEQEEFLLSLVAMDTGSPPLTGSGTVRIIVQDLNDHSPEFERQFYHATIHENVPIGSMVISPKALDKDAGLNSRIKYSILGDEVERFTMDPDSGAIKTAVILDREEKSHYHLTLLAQDSSVTEPRTTAVNLTVTVIDENDNYPIFALQHYEVYIPDNTKRGDFVFGARATDNDDGINSQIIYSLMGEHARNFTINPKTGVIKAAQDLSRNQFDRISVFTVEIEAADGGKMPKKASTQLRIFLKPAQYFPRFTSPAETNFVITENVEEGKLIAKFNAVSPKDGSAGLIKYAIAGGNIGDALKMDKVAGEVFVAGKGLDYETSPKYQVWIEAKDSDNPPLRTVLQLIINVTDANDNAPVMTKSLYNATVLEEESPPQLVVKVSATDADSEENSQILYKLVNDFEGSFQLDPESGEIYTNVKLDREHVANYELVVQAIDQGTPQLTGTATVLVNVLDKNDNPPRFTRLFSVNVTENAEIGSFVIRVTSSDQDIGENANATYSFTENPGEKFSIDPVSGNVTVVGALDREQQDEYLLKVVAVDGAWRAETPLTITIQDQNDNAPEFEHSFYSFNFPELQRNIVFVGQVSATDKDKQGPNSVISYSLQQPSDLFSIDPASGELFSKRSLRYKYSQLEHSPENSYSLTVLATDNGKPPMSSECLVTVNVVDANNNAPKFEQKDYLSPVPEMAEIGQKLVQVAAKDSLDYGVNAEVEYLITGGNGTSHFAIDKGSGWVVLSKRIIGIGKTFVLKVRAVDRGVPPQHDEAIITLVVVGENLHSPVFSALRYQVFVPENEPIGTTILTVNATDDDDGPNGFVRYSISAGNSKKEFDINPITGAVTISEPLDYDTIQEYRLNITGTDLGIISRKTTAMLTITLTDINDNAPIFTKASHFGYISENAPMNTFVCSLTATDIDSPKNAIIQYAIVGGTGKGMFAIDPKTGRIVSRKIFDFEEENVYNLKVMASNPDSPMYSSTEVTVHITGVNEFYPKFIQPVFHFDISESAEIGTSVGSILATDQDSGDDGKVYYLFVGSSNDKGFSIRSDTGVISVSRGLDRETQNRVVLTVIAKNFGGIRGNDTDEAQVIITIQDGNDPPEFLQTLYEASISEGVPSGTKVIVVKAVDKDVRPQNNQFTYSIIGGNMGHAFKVDQQTGVVETARLLDRESIPVYSLVVGGIDTGIPPQTGSTTVKITVLDINDNGPIFEPSDVLGYVSENEPPGTSVMTLSAKDPDLPPNGAPFTYILVGGKHKEYVAINKHTGEVRTTKTLDREQIPALEVFVEVEDNGIPKMSSRHSIKIIVTDQNDSPSSARSVHVLVHTFDRTFPTGKIADVHPNDPDTTGEYKCKLIQSSATSGILSVPFGCDLHTSRIVPGQGYSVSISGNDGKHQDVISTVTVEFSTFDNTTIDNSLAVMIGNMSAQHFVAHHYKGMLDFLKSSMKNGDSSQVYSLSESRGSLLLTLAVKNNREYRSKAYIAERLLKKRDVLVSILDNPNVTIGYSPCNQNVCKNRGLCREEIVAKRETVITDSPNLIFTSPLVLHDVDCRCVDGFVGKYCDKRQDPCLPNPCKAGAQCRRQGFDFVCVCPFNRDGKYCEEEKGDVCSNDPCQNGGSCKKSPDGLSFFCLCRPGYRGNQCETVADSCRPNPCLHGGLCVSLKPGYECSCTDGRYGKHCEKHTFSFKDLSFMTFPTLDASTNDISFTFATTKPNALLAYNYGLQTGGRSDFVAIELIKGRAVFSFGGTRTAITSVSVGGKTSNLADGTWHKIIATRNGRVISLSVASCTVHGDFCEECKLGDHSCYADDIGPTGTLNFNNQPLFIGGLNNADPLLERPGQVHSDDLVGCVHSVSVNGRALNLSSPVQSRGIEPTCSRRNTCSGTNVCGAKGTCFDKWHQTNCRCGNLIAPNCGPALRPVSLTEGGFIEFQISEKHRRMQLLESLYGGSTLWGVNRKTRAAAGNGAPLKTVSLAFRTVKKDGTLFYSASNNHFTLVEITSGQIVYMSKLGSVVNMTTSHPNIVDGKWHTLTLASQNQGIQLWLDSSKLGDELDAAGVHDFLDPYLTAMFVGGVRRNVFGARASAPVSFEGCLANFSINHEVQPFNGSGTIFPDVTAWGKALGECHGAISVRASPSTDPLSIGITLVVIFFVILVGLLALPIVCRIRKQSKEKSCKENGGPTMLGGPVGPDNLVGRQIHPGDSGMSYHSENGDVIRGHHIVGPELLPKKFKERDAMVGEHPRSQRPDIIEREVVSKSPPMREDHHPLPLPPSSHGHDHAVSDMNSELPEHYDLENASSIAPSDIDIVYHYKGFREAGAMRKYKATPPPVSGFHHKHATPQAQAQHRHSPHHAANFPPRGPPVNSGSVSRSHQSTHQSTPLARLSPSSEMSAQQPRILTLHDISGKPLQTALLATTSSSGGVGKDVLHSNSERSLNSPVMSQLSGQSSGSHKLAVAPSGPNSSAGLGLTAEEIERLNARPRTSSLVSTLDAVSSSSEAPRGQMAHLHHPSAPDTRRSSTSTDESGNDSFTCSEIEYDNASLAGDKYKPSEAEPPRRSEQHQPNGKPVPAASYDGFDSSFRGSLSTLVASDDELAGPMYRPPAGAPSAATGLGWDYLLNWGSNFESLVGVFKDIGELPDAVNGRVPNSLRLPSAPKPSEEYV